MIQPKSNFLTNLMIAINKKIELKSSEKTLANINKIIKTKPNNLTIETIYQLEQIAHTSIKNYWLVIKILTLLIRNHLQNHENSSSLENFTLIQTAINILVKIDINKSTENEEIDLSYCDLRGINLESANLENVNLYQSNLAQVNLTNANLKSAILTAANLENAILKSANLETAILCSANLNYANLELANLRKANLYLATLKSTNLNNTILEKANLREVKFT